MAKRKRLELWIESAGEDHFTIQARAASTEASPASMPDRIERTLERAVERALRKVLAARPVPTAVTLKQAAQMLGISANTARKLRLPRNSTGLIPYEAVLAARNP